MNRLLQSSLRKQNDPMRKESKNDNEAYKTTNSFAENDVILRRLFSILCWEDLKTCRLVCSKWESLSRYFFIRLSRLLIQYPVSGMTPEQFQRDFNIVIKGVGGCLSTLALRGHFRLSLLTKLTHQVQTTTLYVDALRLIDENGKMIKTLDCGCLLSENVNELFVNAIDHCRRRDGLPQTTVYVHCDSLTSMEVVYLNNCVVVVDGGRMKPRELTLKLVSFAKGNRKVEQVKLNAFVDFDKINQLIIWGSFTDSVWKYSVRQCTIEVDLSSAVQAHSLQLWRTHVTDWSKANWSVDTLTLSDFPFEKATRLKFKTLVTNSLVNLSFLPQTIQKLVLKECRLTQNDEETCIVLPKLKALHLEGPDKDIIRRFARCPLEHLYLQGMVTAQLNWLHQIPISIKTITMRAFNTFYESTINSPSFRLDTLILQGYNKLESIERILKAIKPNQLIMINEKGQACLLGNEIEPLLEKKFKEIAIL